MSCTNCGCDQPLNDLMDIDHVITVGEDGHVTEPQGIYAPELEMEVDDDGQILNGHEADYKAEAARQGWELLEGFTGQHGYRGPVMHPSEYVGGGLEDHIRETPGTYVAIVVRCSDGEDAGWAVAYRPPPECGCTVPPGGPDDTMIASRACPVHGADLRAAVKPRPVQPGMQYVVMILGQHCFGCGAAITPGDHGYRGTDGETRCMRCDRLTGKDE